MKGFGLTKLGPFLRCYGMPAKVRAMKNKPCKHCGTPWYHGLKQSPWLKSVDFWTQLEALGHNSATTAGYGLLKDESPRVCEIVMACQLK